MDGPHRGLLLDLSLSSCIDGASRAKQEAQDAVLRGAEAAGAVQQRLQEAATSAGWDEAVPKEARELVLACLQLRPQDRPSADMGRDKCWEL